LYILEAISAVVKLWTTAAETGLLFFVNANDSDQCHFLLFSCSFHAVSAAVSNIGLL
jgi:hypothetical protein